MHPHLVQTLGEYSQLIQAGNLDVIQSDLLATSGRSSRNVVLAVEASRMMAMRVCTAMRSVSAGNKRTGAAREAKGNRAGRLQVRAKAESKEEKEKITYGGRAQQLLGFRQAEGADKASKLELQIQLMKPGTWIPVCWGVICGAAASGNFQWIEGFPRDILLSTACIVLSGPCLTGFTQVINDWYDRDLDAINEPNRPIPSGRITGQDVLVQALLLMFSGWGLALYLDNYVGHEFPTLTSIALFGTFISYIYSAPPLKLKQNGWQGTYALGASYIALPWWAGQSLFGELSLEIIVLTLMYSVAGLGIAIVNDFKSIEGDRELGLKSLPVVFGVEKAKYITVGTIDTFQLAVAAYLWAIDSKPYALVLLGLIVPQVYAQIKYFLPDPIKNDVAYQARAQPFLVLGILTTALAIGHNPYH